MAFFKAELKANAVSYWVETRPGLTEPYVGFGDIGSIVGSDVKIRLSLVLSQQSLKAVNVSRVSMWKALC